jgi:hypothetical protein
MNTRWRLRTAAAQREVWTGTELRRLLAEKAGLEMSAAKDFAAERPDHRPAAPTVSPPDHRSHGPSP